MICHPMQAYNNTSGVQMPQSGFSEPFNWIPRSVILTELIFGGLTKYKPQLWSLPPLKRDVFPKN